MACMAGRSTALAPPCLLLCCGNKSVRSLKTGKPFEASGTPGDLRFADLEMTWLLYSFSTTESSKVTHHGTWGRSTLLLMTLVDGRCVLPEPIGWLCLQLD